MKQKTTNAPAALVAGLKSLHDDLQPRDKRYRPVSEVYGWTDDDRFCDDAGYLLPLGKKSIDEVANSVLAHIRLKKVMTIYRLETAVNASTTIIKRALELLIVRGDIVEYPSSPVHWYAEYCPVENGKPFVPISRRVSNAAIPKVEELQDNPGGFNGAPAPNSRTLRDLREAVDWFIAQGKPFTRQQVCDRAGVTHVNSLIRQKALHHKCVEAIARLGGDDIGQARTRELARGGRPPVRRNKLGTQAKG